MFTISEVEITRVDCISNTHPNRDKVGSNEYKVPQLIT